MLCPQRSPERYPNAVAIKAKDAAEAGFKAMDAIDPDWWRHIDLDTLKMSSCVDCVLGQCFGSFAAGVGALEAKYDGCPGEFPEVQLGFDVRPVAWDYCSIASPEAEYKAERDRRYDAIGAEWKQEIMKRRAAEHFANQNA